MDNLPISWTKLSNSLKKPGWIKLLFFVSKYWFIERPMGAHDGKVGVKIKQKGRKWRRNTKNG